MVDVSRDNDALALACIDTGIRYAAEFQNTQRRQRRWRQVQ